MKVVQVDAHEVLVNPNQRCGKCGDLIGDFWDDCGYFYKYFEDKYVPHCRSCTGPLTGDR